MVTIQGALKMHDTCGPLEKGRNRRSNTGNNKSDQDQKASTGSNFLLTLIRRALKKDRGLRWRWRIYALPMIRNANAM